MATVDDQELIAQSVIAAAMNMQEQEQAGLVQPQLSEEGRSRLRLLDRATPQDWTRILQEMQIDTRDPNARELAYSRTIDNDIREQFQRSAEAYSPGPPRGPASARTLTGAEPGTPTELLTLPPLPGRPPEEVPSLRGPVPRGGRDPNAANIYATPLGIPAFGRDIMNMFAQTQALLGSGVPPSDPRVVQNALDIASLVSSGSFSYGAGARAVTRRGAAEAVDQVPPVVPRGVPREVPAPMSAVPDVPPPPRLAGTTGEFTLSGGGAADRPGVAGPRVRFEIIPDETNPRWHRINVTADRADVGYAHVRYEPTTDTIHFGNVELRPEMRGRGLGNELQRAIEARLGRPMAPDDLLTEAAYRRWRRFDPDAVANHRRNPKSNATYPWERPPGTPLPQTQRMQQIRALAEQGRLRPPRGPREGGFTLGMGGAADRPPPRPPPTDLDQAGFYSHAGRTAAQLPVRGPGADMLNNLVKLGGRGVEREIRALNLDVALLGEGLARSRRYVQDTADQLSTLIRERQSFFKDHPTDNPRYLEGKATEFDNQIDAASRAAQQAARMHTERMSGANTGSFTRQQVADIIEQNRPRIGERTYEQPRYNIPENRRTEALNKLSDPEAVTAALRRAGMSDNRDWAARIGRQLSRDAYDAEDLSVIVRSLGDFVSPTTDVARDVIAKAIKDLTGYTPGQLSRRPTNLSSVNRYAQFNIDPNNPTLVQRVLNIPMPDTPAINRLWQDIPARDAHVLRAAWGTRLEDMENTVVREQVARLRAAHEEQLTRIQHATQGRSYQDPHFNQQNVWTQYMASLQRLPDGSMTFVPNQMQSRWATDILERPELPRHALIASTNAWVDPTLRRIISDAVEQGATSISIPSGATVGVYNPGLNPRIHNLYDDIIPRRLRTIFQEVDRNYTPNHIRPTSQLLPYDHSYQAMQPKGVTPGESIRYPVPVTSFEGHWRTFALTPAIIERYAPGQGRRLFTAGIPVPTGQPQQQGQQANAP